MVCKYWRIRSKLYARKTWIGLVVASSPSEAKNKAKSKWLIDCKKKHKDDISVEKKFTDVDDCEVIKYIKDLEIELTLKDNYVVQENTPDWFGYMRIDKK